VSALPSPELVAQIALPGQRQCPAKRIGNWQAVWLKAGEHPAESLLDRSMGRLISLHKLEI